MNRRQRVRTRLILAVAVLLALAVGAYWLYGDTRHPGRYGEIRAIIVDNLHFGRHFTWATNTKTIKAVRPHLTEADVPVLSRLLRDERAAVAIAAAHLLELLGPAGEAALRRATEDPNVGVRMYAQDALGHIAQCRDPAVRNLDRAVCPVHMVDREPGS